MALPVHLILSLFEMLFDHELLIISKYILLELGYLPPCKGVPIMATQSAWVVDLNYIPIQSKNCEILASITCTSGLAIQVKSMKFSDGCWDAAVRSVGQDAISSLRQ